MEHLLFCACWGWLLSTFITGVKITILAGRSNTYAMRFDDVKKINEHRRNDYIEIYGGLFNYNHIYVYPHQYEFVLGYIKARCQNLA